MSNAFLMRRNAIVLRVVVNHSRGIRFNSFLWARRGGLRKIYRTVYMAGFVCSYALDRYTYT